MSKHPTNKTWTPEQDAKLLDLISKGGTAARASAALKRTTVAVQTRARVLGKPFKSLRAARADLKRS